MNRSSQSMTRCFDTDCECRRCNPTLQPTVLLCLDPPVPLVVSSVCAALYRCGVCPGSPPVSFTGACVFVPCGILRAPWPSEWSRVRSAASSVARVCLLTPLLLRTTVIWPSISSSLQEERGGGRWDVSLTYHGVQLSNFDTTSSTPQHVQATTQSQIRSGQHLVHVHTRFIIMLATCKV